MLEEKQSNQEKSKELDVNERQELFCQLYASDKEFFGNGVQSYLAVYKPDTSKPNWYKTACASASQLLSNIKVTDRINELLEENGLNDAFVDKQLHFLITQYADFGSKMNAIKEYNKLKQRITDKTDITSGGKPIPILNVLTDNSHKENTSDVQENPGSTGGDISEQDNINRTGLDRPLPEGQSPEVDQHSIGIITTLEEGSNTGLFSDNAGTSILQGQSLE